MFLIESGLVGVFVKDARLGIVRLVNQLASPESFPPGVRVRAPGKRDRVVHPSPCPTGAMSRTEFTIETK